MMHGHRVVDEHAAAIGRLPLPEARAELARILRHVGPLRETDTLGYVDALDWNARLVTRLRQRGVKIWGAEPEHAT